MFGWANPKRFMELSGAVLPWVAGAAGLFLIVGLYLSVTAPPDYQQGDSVRIMFVHDGLWLDGACFCDWPYKSTSVGRRGGQGSRSARGALHGACAHHRLALGGAYVGNLLGMGRAIDILFAPAVSVLRLHGSVERHRG